MARNIYDSRQRWTVLFIAIAAVIIIMTVVVSRSFSYRLSEEERHKVDVWAEATHLMIADTDDAEDLSMNLILKILNGNTSIPVILCDTSGTVQSYKNIEIGKRDTLAFFAAKIEAFKAKNPPIAIQIGEGVSQYLYYDESLVLKQLKLYPYVQLGVVIAFILVTFFALLSAKKAEQNKVWVGLSKETAHQLGTPISSLMAWVEYLKSKSLDESIINEMGKDVERLNMIADRFSKIGSNADIAPLNINSSIRSAYEYMCSRVSKKVKIETKLTDAPLLVLMNDSLFSWVIENLTKNAVDAMHGQGTITYSVEERGRKVFVDVSDTGKGVPKSRFKAIFNPGYTTKERGWGLGLSLVKRIVESYPGGKIYVKSSEQGKGTTFRIELKKYNGRNL